MQTLVAEILAAWRRAERLATELPPGTSEHTAAVTACERLRELYQDMTKAGPYRAAEGSGVGHENRSAEAPT
jgi:hypothetical protein